LKAKSCSCCQADLSEQTAELVDVNQITELPPGKAEVIEVRQYGVTCQGCGHVEIQQPPEGMEMERTFGARLEATVTYYRQEQHMSYERTKVSLQALHGVEISEGGIDQIMQRSGQKGIYVVAEIKTIIQQSTVVNSDETGARVECQRASFAIIRDHRKVTGGFRFQWGADAYAALASVIDTAALKGINAFDALQSLIGRPALPLTL